MTIQKIQQIRIVSRPLEQKLSKVKQSSQNCIQNLLNQFVKEQDWQHYAVIVNTAQEQLILHNLSNGYTKNNIQDSEIRQYTDIYNYRQENFTQPIYLSDIENLSNENKQYNILNNSCIHFVNRVIIYLNERLTTYDEKNIKIKLNSIDHIFKGIIKESWKQFSTLYQTHIKKQKLKTKPSGVNFIASYSTQILEYIIWNFDTLSWKQALSLFFIMATLQFLSLFPLVGGIISFLSILAEIGFIWSQKDDQILEKFTKTLQSSLLIGMGYFCNNFVQIFYRQCLKLTSVIYEKYKAKIMKLTKIDCAIVTTTTALGAAIGIFSSTIAQTLKTISTSCASILAKPAAVATGSLTTEIAQVSSFWVTLTNPTTLMATVGFCLGLGIIWILKKYF